MNIEHFPEKKVFQTVVDGETARLMYHVADGALDVRHTIVPGEIGGRGIASALVKAAYDMHWLMNLCLWQPVPMP